MSKEKEIQEVSILNTLRINKYKLDDECENQPNLYFYWSKQLTDEKSNKMRLENKLEYLSAKADLDLRKSPPEGVKITEGSIKALLAEDKSLQRVKESILDSKERIYHLESVVRALEQRRSDLDNLVVLYSKNYFALPTGKNINDQTSKEVKRRLRKEKK